MELGVSRIGELFHDGFHLQNQGHTITAVLDPSSFTETGFIRSIAEPEEADCFPTIKDVSPLTTHHIDTS